MNRPRNRAIRHFQSIWPKRRAYVKYSHCNNKKKDTKMSIAFAKHTHSHIVYSIPLNNGEYEMCDGEWKDGISLCIHISFLSWMHIANEKQTVYLFTFENCSRFFISPFCWNASACLVNALCAGVSETAQRMKVMHLMIHGHPLSRVYLNEWADNERKQKHFYTEEWKAQKERTKTKERRGQQQQQKQSMCDVQAATQMHLRVHAHYT